MYFAIEELLRDYFPNESKGIVGQLAKDVVDLLEKYEHWQISTYINSCDEK